MKYIKHIVARLGFLIIAIGFPYLGHAQVVVTNPTGLANDIYTFIEQNYQHGEEMIQLGHQLEAALQSLDAAKENIALVRKTFTVAAEYFEDATILVETYDNLQSIYNDVERIRKLVKYYENDGKITPTQIYTTTKMIGEITGRAVDTWNFAKNQIVSDKNNLTLHERMQQLDKINKEFRRYHNIFKGMANGMQKEVAQEDYNDGREIAAGALMTQIPGGKPTEEEKDKIDQYVSDVAARVQTDVENLNGGATTPAKPVRVSSEFQKKVIHIVMMVITLLAVLFFGWNFGVYNHGDRQRTDVLWKVGAGYIVMMIFLSVFDQVVVFNL